jgi:hypothetical protein
MNVPAARVRALLSAAVAGAVEHDLVLVNAHRDAAAELLDRALQFRISERCDRSAAVADEVMVVIVLAAERLVTRHRLTDVDPLDEVEALQLIEDPVDAGASHRPRPGAQCVLDLKRGERARLRVEELQDRASGGAVVPAAVRQNPLRVLYPPLLTVAGGRLVLVS